ncbi:MAG: hypothetical protein ACRD0P_38090, partial [Stackebrandtia sp.]
MGVTDRVAAPSRFGAVWWTLDVVLAGLAVLFGASAAAEAQLGGWYVLLVGALVGVPVAVRRRWPGPALATICAGLAVLVGTGGMSQGAAVTVFAVSPGLVLYRAVRVTPPLKSIGDYIAAFAMAAMCAVTVVAIVVFSFTAGWTTKDVGGFAFISALAFGAGAGLGRFVHERHASRRLVLSVRDTKPAEHRRPDAGQELVAVERERIGAELRGLATGRLSRIATEAELAARSARQAEDVNLERQCRATADTARVTLFDTRALLRRLTDDPDDSWKTVLPPGIADLPAVVARAGRAGVEVMLGDPADLPK